MVVLNITLTFMFFGVYGIPPSAIPQLVTMPSLFSFIHGSKMLYNSFSKDRKSTSYAGPKEERVRTLES